MCIRDSANTSLNDISAAVTLAAARGQAALRNDHRAQALHALAEAQALSANLDDYPTLRWIEALSHALNADTALIVDPQGSYLIKAGERVELQRRGPMRRILVALMKAHQQSPGQVVSTDELFAQGWPDQKIARESAKKRVYTAIWTLRSLALEEDIISGEGGYLLHPARQCRWG